MQTVLVADDRPDELESLRKILEEEGKYAVKTASTPDGAMELLNPKQIRVAVIDYRLNGGASDDESGLLVARDASHEIPKIMISGVADEKQIRAAFGVDSEGRQIVSDFLDKDEVRTDHAKLLSAVKAALQTRAIMDRRARESVRGQLLTDYKNARRLDLANTILSLFVNLIFVFLLILTLSYAHSGEIGIVVTAIISVGIIVSEIAVNVLMAKRLEGSSRRAENYHAELLQAWSFEQLMRAADGLDFVQTRNKAKGAVILAFANRWNKPSHGNDPESNERLDTNS